MKFKILYLALFVCTIGGYAQIESNLQSVDSIQSVLKKSKNRDSVFVAYNYYKIAELYRYSKKNDSAFYYYSQAEKVFDENNLKLELAAAYYGIAAIQSDEKDFTGSEVTSIKGLSVLETLDETNDINKYKSFIYNNLGIVSAELGQYEGAVKYYKKALSLKRGLKGDFSRSVALTINNLGFLYKTNGNYKLAIETFNEILIDKDFLSINPSIHILVLGNYAHTLDLADEHDQLPKLYLKALKIADSIGEVYNTIIINRHLAEFYYDRNRINSAKYYAYKAKHISEEYFADDLLKSLKLLAKIEEGANSISYLNQYIKLSDSLSKVERATRNKFARIRFETKQIEKENIEIARERMWLLVVSIVVVLASILLYIVIYQKNKNKELLFAQKQQEANEEIYNLMLSQNEGIEEARIVEKKRISEELHDGILGRLFGTRLSLDSLNMSNSVEAIKTRSEYINELKDIEQEIRKVSHELNADFVSGSSFINIIKTLVETQTIAFKLKYKLDCEETINWEKVPNKTKIHIYRIIQEALHNIYKHADAKNVSISFTLDNDKIYLILSDDGCGFNADKVSPGIGLKNINSRVSEIKGVLSIVSEKDSGTALTIVVPIV